MRYASVCSGIEAATVAWHGLGWKPVWFSQYDPEHNYKSGPDFPSSVLAHRFPEVPNLGDMTKLRDNDIYKRSEFDLLVGGTPCQAFSIAGLRAGLDDDRSNLALEFIRILRDKRPRWFLWENVPGVLSSNGGADFASILSGFTGRDVGVQKFEKDGIIEGDEYSVAWRVLDSQYFGVPQQRRRVFVVGHIGNDWRPPTAVLVERESLRRDFTPGGKKRKVATGSTESRITCTGDGITGTVSCKWAKGTGGPAGDEHYNLVAHTHILCIPINTMVVQGRPSDEGRMGSGIGENGAPQNTLSKAHHHAVCYGISGNVIGRADGNESKTAAVFLPAATVRRLTPMECERLQGFPDGWTDVPGASDSKRYAALGNSMTTNVMHWIGDRINKVQQAMDFIDIL